MLWEWFKPNYYYQLLINKFSVFSTKFCRGFLYSVRTSIFNIILNNKLTNDNRLSNSRMMWQFQFQNCWRDVPASVFQHFFYSIDNVKEATFVISDHVSRPKPTILVISIRAIAIVITVHNWKAFHSQFAFFVGSKNLFRVRIDNLQVENDYVEHILRHYKILL